MSPGKSGATLRSHCSKCGSTMFIYLKPNGKEGRICTNCDKYDSLIWENMNWNEAWNVVTHE